MATNNFRPEVWSRELINSLSKIHVYAGLLSNDYTGTIRAVGDTVHAHAPTITIRDKTNTRTATGVDCNLTVNRSLQLRAQVKDIDAAQSNSTYVKKTMQQAAYGLADVADQHVAKQIQSAIPLNATIGVQRNPEYVDETNAYHYLLSLRRELSRLHAPMLRR